MTQAKRIYLALSLTTALCLCLASSASALTLGVGWSGNPPANVGEMPLVGKSGASTFRVPMGGGFGSEASDNNLVMAAAENGVAIHAELSSGTSSLPTGAARTEFIAWAHRAVELYGYNGQFWAAHPSLPYRPITAWEVWNEPNNQGIGATEYAQLLNEVANTIQSASQSQAGRNTDVLSAGLLVWGNTGKGSVGYLGAMEYLAQAYATFGSNANVTGVAIHPYELDSGTFLNGSKTSRIEAFKYAVAGYHTKLVELAKGGSQKSLWITETGWPAEGPYAVGETEQASLLRQVVDYLRSNESSLNVKDLLWYNFRDAPGAENWDNYCGLRAHDGHFRLAWTAFQEKAGVAQVIPQGGDGHPVSMRDPVTNQFWIYYRGSEGYIRELYRNPTTGEWANNKVPATEAAAAGASPAIGRNSTTNAQWIYYQGADGYIWELYRDPKSGSWFNTKIPNAQPAGEGSNPTMLGDPTTGAAWIYYRASDGYLWELYRNPTTGVWANNKVPATQSAAKGTTPVIGRNSTTNAQWIYYQGADGYIWELYRDPKTGNWFNTKIPGAQAASPGSSPTMLGDPTTGEAWIEYRGSDGYIWQLWRNPSTGIWANSKFPTAQM
jgi:hypothetical protein